MTGRWKRIVLLYGISLLASHAVRWVHPWRPPSPTGLRVEQVPAFAGAHEVDRAPVRYAFLEAGDPDRPTVVLLHGSPGSHREVGTLARLLSDRYHVIAPDLPGFGASSHRIPDYSIRAHAAYTWALLDSLHVHRAHLLGFSLGGGVALEMAGLAPERVRSLVMLSAIGAQEFELLGDYHLNHLLHGLQLAGLWGIQELVPHFGLWDGGFFGIEYARNFYDTDQRPLRGIMADYTGPMLIIQGDRDPLVPSAAARETHRLVPQSDLLMLSGDHFMAFQRADDLAIPVARFLAQADSGIARTRNRATPERVAAAAAPLDPATIPPATGVGFVALILLLGVATLISEDLTCIGAGLLVARGTIGFLPATLACLVGITAGDMLLFLAGRTVGRGVLRRPPLKWFINEGDVVTSSVWFRQKGPWIVLASRFLPGTRLPTYLAAGILHTRFLVFALVFVIASLLWTPMLVGAATVFGEQVFGIYGHYQRWAGPRLLLVALGCLVAIRLLIRLATWRGRRLLRDRWRRMVRWEFWPRWAIYLPVVPYILWKISRARCLSLFTCVNPAIPGGGFAGESKADILTALAEGTDRVAPFVVLPDDAEARVEGLRAFQARHGIAWPVVLKPDVGERGGGVRVVRSQEEAAAYFAQARGTVLAQAYVPGREYGIFWYRRPGEERGRIFAITDKRFPTVTGDGRRTLEALILADDRLLGMVRWFLRQHAGRLTEVLPAGVVRPLTELGTHALGATFLDGTALRTPALEEAVNRAGTGYPGFWFGRFDVRTPSEEALQCGEFRIIELNGATSEATSIYDPRYSVVRGWRTLLDQWRILFDIAEANRRDGARPSGVVSLLYLLRRRWEANAQHARHTQVGLTNL